MGREGLTESEERYGVIIHFALTVICGPVGVGVLIAALMRVSSDRESQGETPDTTENR
jgi:hypothetical protein